VSAAPSRWRSRAPAAGLAACAITIAIILASTRAPETTPAPAPSPTPDRSGAAAAALRYTQELAVTGVHEPSVYGPRLRQIAASGAEDEVRADFGDGAAEVRALVRGRAGVLRAAPIGYRIESLDATRASVAVWMVALAGGPLLEPVAQWRLLTIELRWTAQGWKVSGGHGARGPSPRMPLPVLAERTATFEEVRHVP
jgi:hypothetical protein